MDLGKIKKWDKISQAQILPPPHNRKNVTSIYVINDEGARQELDYHLEFDSQRDRVVLITTYNGLSIRREILKEDMEVYLTESISTFKVLSEHPAFHNIMREERVAICDKSTIAKVPILPMYENVNLKTGRGIIIDTTTNRALSIIKGIQLQIKDAISVKFDKVLGTIPNQASIEYIVPELELKIMFNLVNRRTGQLATNMKLSHTDEEMEGFEEYQQIVGCSRLQDAISSTQVLSLLDKANRGQKVPPMDLRSSIRKRLQEVR